MRQRRYRWSGPQAGCYRRARRRTMPVPGAPTPGAWSGARKGFEMTSMFSARPSAGRSVSRAPAAMAPATPGVAVAAGSCWRSVRDAAGRQFAADRTAPGRRGLQLCLGLIWLLDAALQYQPFMFGPSFVAQVVEPAETGNPHWVTGPVTWASQMMLHHTAAFNAVFASIQLLIAARPVFPPHRQARTGRLTRFRLSFRAPTDSQDGSQPS